MSTVPHTWRSLSALIGFHESRVCRLRRRPWWPDLPRGLTTPDALTQAEAEEYAARCHAAILEHVQTKTPIPSSVAAAPGGAETSPPPSPRAGTAAPARASYPPELLAQLRDASDPIEITEASIELLKRRLAHGLEFGGDGADPRAFDNLKKALEELRVAKGSWLDLHAREGRLIPRPAASAAVAALGQRLVQTLNDVQALLPTQVLVWFGSPEFRAKGTEEQQRTVREWWEAKSRALRQLLSDELEELLSREAQGYLEKKKAKGRK